MRFVTLSGHAHIGQASLGAALAGGLWLAAAAAAAQTSGLDGVPSRWDMSLADTNRKCEIRLRDDAGGHTVGMPAGCRRAIPILVDVGAWAQADRGRLDFEDASGKPVLEFAPAKGGDLEAKGPQGETYRLVAAADDGPTGFSAMQPSPSAGGFRPVPQAGGSAAASVIMVANAPASAPAGSFLGKAADVAGRYIILRDGGKDTGCMLTLDDKARGPHASLKAVLAPACRDQGIVIFDPVGWEIANGRLALIARKGHQTRLDRQPDGTWTKDPSEGQPLGLKKM